MAKFMDEHEGLHLPTQMVSQLAESARHGVRDAHGVAQLEAYYNPQGRVFCLLDAPDEDAVRRHHADLGVECGPVHPVESLL